jgi:hypothetical protein
MLCFPFEPPTAPCVAMGDGGGPAPSPRRVDDSTLLPCQTVSPWLRLQRLCRGGALRFAADAYKAMQRVWDLTNSHGLRWLLRVQVVCHLPTPQLSKQCVCVFSSQRRAAALAAVASGKVALGGAPVEGGAGEAAATLPIAKQGDLTLYSDVSGSVHS